jgi:hypothetical protein
MVAVARHAHDLATKKPAGSRRAELEIVVAFLL